MYDYALVHVVYTIPVALVLTVILYPLFTKRDLYKICFLLGVAVAYTIPWDSYLIRTGVWTYPPDVILGPTLFDIPAEELFFFVIQTYITTLLHILLNKSVLFATYLRDDSDYSVGDVRRLHFKKRLGQIFFGFGFVVPFSGLVYGNARPEGTYMRLISAWASPVLFLLWSLSYQFLTSLPRSKVSLPITLPTLYLWIVDTIALRRGTWSISSGTKLGIEVWPGLEIEEAVFFLVTNILVVFGSVAFDNAIAILDTFPSLFPTVPSLPSPELLIRALLVPTSSYSTERLNGIKHALTILSRKSRSFYLASGVFAGRLRIDLILLYAFCRVADDLVDNSTTPDDAEKWIKHLSHFLKTAYSPKHTDTQLEAALNPFPEDAQAVLSLLPVDKLPPQPLYALLDGFRIDVSFLRSNSAPPATATRSTTKPPPPPIQTIADLETYASHVASTVAELCLSLVYAHDPNPASTSSATRTHCLTAGKHMGLVLQYVNIVRDVAVDAHAGRCYIPNVWLANSSPQTFAADVIQSRKKILDIAFQLYYENRGEIELLPAYARDGIRVAVESYMEIGRELKRKMERGEDLDAGEKGRASVPGWRRIWVGWWSMGGWGRKAVREEAQEKEPRKQ